MRWTELAGNPCPVARAMSVIGDRWTILILRDCFRGATRFEDFHARIGASRAILSERLGALVEAGVLQRVAYEQHPPRYDYRLTPRGQALGPVMMMLTQWGEAHLPVAHGRRMKRRHTKCGHLFQPVVSCSECGEPIRAGEVEYPDAHLYEPKKSRPKVRA